MVGFNNNLFGFLTFFFWNFFSEIYVGRSGRNWIYSDLIQKDNFV